MCLPITNKLINGIYKKQLLQLIMNLKTEVLLYC